MKSEKKKKEREKKVKAKLFKRREWTRKKQKEERTLALLKDKVTPKQKPFVKAEQESEK